MKSFPMATQNTMADCCKNTSSKLRRRTPRIPPLGGVRERRSRVHLSLHGLPVALRPRQWSRCQVRWQDDRMSKRIISASSFQAQRQCKRSDKVPTKVSVVNSAQPPVLQTQYSPLNCWLAGGLILNSYTSRFHLQCVLTAK